VSLRGVADWLRKHRWLAALIGVVVLGYGFGKDMALRDNARDAAVVQVPE
jgi:hypothetical protein